jgi:hypothetical protein
MEGYHRCGSTNTSYCIDEELLCDKFPHCLDESDENESCINRKYFLNIFDLHKRKNCF